MSRESATTKESMPADGILSKDYPTCPFRNVISRFGDKWTLLILYVISNAGAPIRFSEIEQQIPDISSRMLSSCLRNLEADNLVTRKIYPCVPPKVEYSLTETGQSLIPHLKALTEWAIDHFDEVISHRAKYNKSHRTKA